MKTIWIMFWFLFSLLAGVDAQSDTPYIYYYSREENGFIISKADGTDKQLLAEYRLEETYLGQLAIDGAGWSPSGRYFSWMSRPSMGGGSYADRIFILDVETSSQYTITTANFEGIDYIEWSPDKDLLLILTYSDINDLSTPYITVHNPDLDEDVFSYTLPENFSLIIEAYWSPDGKYILIQDYMSVYLIEVDTYTVEVLPANFQLYFFPAPTWISSVELSYNRNLGEVVIYNTTTSDFQTIMLSDLLIEMVDWSPDRGQALIFMRSDLDDITQLYLYSPDTDKADLVDENIVFPQHIKEPHWSNDSKYAYYVTNEEELKIIDNNGDISQVVSNDRSLTFIGSQFRWMDNNRIAFSAMNTDSLKLELYVYNISAGTLNNLSNEILSDDIRFNRFTINNGMIIVGNEIVHLDKGTVDSFEISNEINLEPYRADFFSWSTSGEWLFLLTPFNNQYHTKSANIKGFVSPDFSLCPIDSKACYGWMPENSEYN